MIQENTTWEEMLAEFRALGGIADNVRLGYGRYGRGLFPIDPSRPVAIRIPPSLLVRVEYLTFENGVLRVSPTSSLSLRGRTFLEQYEREFSWGAEGRLEIERFLETMQSVPDHLRELLIGKFHLGKFYKPVTPELLQTLFIDSRSIQSGGHRVVMPIIELANHGPLAGYATERGVSLGGTFADEVLVQYSGTVDAYGMFRNWMFAAEEPLAFSIGMMIEAEGKYIQIDRKFEGEPSPWVPQATFDGTLVSLDYLLLGNRNFPRVPKGAFYRAMSAVGVTVSDETYELIQHANRRNFLELIGALEGIESPAMPLLRKLAHSQLTSLSYHYGLRQV